MAFTPDTFLPLSSMANSNAPRQWGYDTGDTIATVKAANYFDAASATSGGLGLLNGDVILVTASDGTSYLRMVVTDGAATTSSALDFA